VAQFPLLSSQRVGGVENRSKTPFTHVSELTYREVTRRPQVKPMGNPKRPDGGREATSTRDSKLAFAKLMGDPRRQEY
jgi:hypothetical protein